MMLVDPALNSPLESMAERIDDSIGTEGEVWGRSHLVVNGEELRTGAISMEHAAVLSYPFRVSSFSNFQSWKHTGGPSPMSLQNMVMHASNGMLHPAVGNEVTNVTCAIAVGSATTQDEDCNAHFVDATSVPGADSSNSDQFCSTKIQEHPFVHVAGMANGGDSVMGGVTLSGNDDGNGSRAGAVQCNISDNEQEAATILVSETEAEP